MLMWLVFVFFLGGILWLMDGMTTFLYVQLG